MNRLIPVLALAALAGPAAMSTVSSANEPLATDVESIDPTINAYYDVISGPEEYRYDAERDKQLHAPKAVITRTSRTGLFRGTTLRQSRSL